MTTPAPPTSAFAVGRRLRTVYLTAVYADTDAVRVLARLRRGAVAVSCPTQALR